MYADWWYLWCLSYYMNLQCDVFIMLKRSLKWTPIVGWVSLLSIYCPSMPDAMRIQGMQIFGFMFVSTWAKSAAYLKRKLGKIAKRATRAEQPLNLMIFPEGTLVSKDTRPLSKKYADKMGFVRDSCICTGGGLADP